MPGGRPRARPTVSVATSNARQARPSGPRGQSVVGPTPGELVVPRANGHGGPNRDRTKLDGQKQGWRSTKAAHIREAHCASVSLLKRAGLVPRRVCITRAGVRKRALASTDQLTCMFPAPASQQYQAASAAIRASRNVSRRPHELFAPPRQACAAPQAGAAIVLDVQKDQLARLPPLRLATTDPNQNRRRP
jgi:hypothetical protein